MGNESLISYRTVLSYFPPTLYKRENSQTLKCLLFSSSKQRYGGKQNMRFEEYWLLPACQQPVALCVLIAEAHALKIWNSNSFPCAHDFLHQQVKQFVFNCSSSSIANEYDLDQWSKDSSAWRNEFHLFRWPVSPGNKGSD